MMRDNHIISRQTTAGISLLFVVMCALVSLFPVIGSLKTISAFDICFFDMPAYSETRPDDLSRASNGLLSDPVLMMNAWDLIMYDDPARFPWLWNQDAGCGSPLLANGQSSPFFPLKLVLPLVDVRRGFGALCLLKLMAAGILTWFFLRRIGLGLIGAAAGGVFFMLSGFMVVWLQYPMSAAALLLPMLLLGGESILEGKSGKGFLLICGGACLSGFAGHPETTFHTLFITGVYVFAGLFRKNAGPVHGGKVKNRVFMLFISFLAMVVGLCVAGPQLVPMIEYIINSADFANRASDTGKLLTDTWLFSNPRLASNEILSYLVPDAWGNPARHPHRWSPFTNYCESAGYTGAATFILAIAAWFLIRRDRRIAVFCFLQLLSLVFILRLTPLRLNPEALPVFNLTANNRFLLLFCFSNAVLGALMIDRLYRNGMFDRPRSIAILTAGILAACWAWFDYNGRFLGNPQQWIQDTGQAQFAHLLFALAPLLAISVTGLCRVRFRPRILAFLLVAVSAWDLVSIQNGFNPFISPEHVYPQTAALRRLAREETPARLLPLGNQIGPNMSGVYGIEDVRIYDALTPAWYQAFLNRLGAEGRWNEVSRPHMSIANLASITHLWTASTDPLIDSTLQSIYTDSTSVVYFNPNALPRAYVASAWKSVESYHDAISAMENLKDSRQMPSLLETGNPTPVCSTDKQNIVAARVVEHTHNRTVIEVPSGITGLLVLNDTYYPGWQASSNGKPLEIHRVNATFRSVFLDGTQESVVFEYRPRSFTLGICIGLAGICTSVFAGWLLRRKT